MASAAAGGLAFGFGIGVGVGAAGVFVTFLRVALIDIGGASVALASDALRRQGFRGGRTFLWGFGGVFFLWELAAGDVFDALAFFANKVLGTPDRKARVVFALAIDAQATLGAFHTKAGIGGALAFDAALFGRAGHSRTRRRLTCSIDALM